MPASFVTTAPPSPAALRFLLGWKLKHAAAPIVAAAFVALAAEPEGDR